MLDRYLWLLGLLLTYCSLAEAACRQNLEAEGPTHAGEFLIRAFQRYPLVALDEGDHQSRQSHEFIAALIRDPRFRETVDDVAVEFANARLQGLLDSYISGAEVSDTDLRQVWRETTQFLVWDSPVYQRFFETVREVNGSLGSEEQVRVLAGDPPIDWSQVQSHEDAMRFSDRDGHFAQVVEREVLARGRRALIIAGGGHLYREEDSDEPNLVQILEGRHPGKILVIKTHDPESEAVEALVSGWPRPGIALLKRTELGGTDAGLAIPQFQEKGKKLEDVADAYLYIVPFNEMTKVPPSPNVYEDEEYVGEIERRYEAVFQEPFPREIWQQLRRRP